MKNRVFCFLLITMFLCVSLTGCGNTTDETTSAATTEPIVSVEPAVVEIEETPVPTAEPTSTSTSAPTATEAPVDGLTVEQRNSIGMLNYLTMFTQEINSAKNSRLYIENAYSTLINNTYPNAVDQDTHYQLIEILNRLEEYRLNAVKRERLEYIYEQNKAQAIRSAVPNPMGLLSAVGSFNWVKLAASVAYMAVDSVTSYQNTSSQADLQYLQDGWELDDAEAATLHKLRTNAFSYMLDIVNTYGWDGDLALNEEAVTNFVNWKMENNIVRRIQLFETNNATYKGFGPYWLTLADSYYQNGDYQKCVDAIAAYETLQTRIFRQDYELAKILPVALLSAMEIQTGDEYNATASHYLELLEQNAAYDDWSLRYFGAQGYIDLYNRTANDEYLNRAYSLVLNNVTQLVSDQITQNETYLADLQKISIPEGATKTKKKEIESLNKQAEEDRKTALAPIDEPLILNCDLLFALADELCIPESEQQKIEHILHDNSQPLFLVPTIDNQYWFEKKNVPAVDDLTIGFDGKVLTLPATTMSEYSYIVMTVTSDEGESVFDDWTVSKVERKEKGMIETFTVSINSESIATFDFKKDMTISINVASGTDKSVITYTFEFAVGEEKTLGIIPRLVYTRTK